MITVLNFYSHLIVRFFSFQLSNFLSNFPTFFPIFFGNSLIFTCQILDEICFPFFLFPVLFPPRFSGESFFTPNLSQNFLEIVFGHPFSVFPGQIPPQSLSGDLIPVFWDLESTRSQVFPVLDSPRCTGARFQGHIPQFSGGPKVSGLRELRVCHNC